MPSTTITDIVLDQWIDLGANRCKSISATALSEAPVPPPPDEEDMPLHSAVYDPTRGKIFAVRGGRVFKFNAATLAKENEVQYAGPTLSDTYIDYDAGRDKLWVTYSTSFRAPPTLQHPTNDMYIYKLNADHLGQEQIIGIGQNNLDVGTQAFQANNVIRFIRSNGVQLACVMVRANLSNGVAFFVFDPDNLPSNIFSRSYTVARWAFIDIRPSSTDYLFCTDDNYNQGVERITNANVLVESGGGYPVIGVDTGSPFTARIYGFAYNPGNNQHYCANRSHLILKLDASAAAVGTAIDLGTAIDVWNVRRNPYSGLIYAADFGGDQVAVIDPSDDSFVLKGGFVAPWDIVFTPDKAIAVQHSAEGLKEIV